MKKVLVLILTILFITLHASAGLCQGNKKQFDEIVSGYFANPKNKILIAIESMRDDKTAVMQCHCSTGQNSKSFDTRAPYAEILDMDNAITELRGSYDKLTENEKQQAELYMAMNMPSIVYVCQNQAYSGLAGKIYFNGKEVSSDIANIDYAVINLTFTLSIEDIIAIK